MTPYIQSHSHRFITCLPSVFFFLSSHNLFGVAFVQCSGLCDESRIYLDASINQGLGAEMYIYSNIRELSVV